MIPIGVPGGIPYPSWREAAATFDTTLVSSGAVGASVGIGVGVLRYLPMLVQYDASIVHFEYTQSSAVGQTGRVGIWAVDPATGLPGALLWDSGVITYTGTGSTAIAVSPSIPVERGYLWLGQVADAAMAVYGQNTIDFTRMGTAAIGTSTKLVGPFLSGVNVANPLPNPATFTGYNSAVHARLGLRYA
jgi:hypothetical protein